MIRYKFWYNFVLNLVILFQIYKKSNIYFKFTIMLFNIAFYLKI